MKLLILKFEKNETIATSQKLKHKKVRQFLFMIHL